MEKQILFEKGSYSSSEIWSAIEELSLMVKTLNNKPQPVLNMIRAEINGDHHDHDHDHDHNHDHRDYRLSSLNIPTKPFLSLCNLVLQVLDKIGPTMAVLRQDVHQNIQRLEKLYESDPLVYSNLVEMVKQEVTEGIAKKGHTCTKSVVWLTRSLDFTVALLRKLVIDQVLSMEQAVEEAYNITLKPWHRWISSAAFRVGLRLVPDTQTFISLLLAKEESHDTLKDNMQTLVSFLVPLLEDIHSVLKFYGLDKIKST